MNGRVFTGLVLICVPFLAKISHCGLYGNETAFLNVRDHVSQPYNTTGNIVLYILINSHEVLMKISFMSCFVHFLFLEMLRQDLNVV